MFEFLGTIGSAILGGGATGLLGVVVQRIADYKNKQLDLRLSREKFRQELQLRRMDLQMLEKEWQARADIAVTESAARMDIADSEAFAKSFNETAIYSKEVKPSKGQGWMLVVLDFIRGIVRPALTMYLCAIATAMYFHARKMMGEQFITPEQAVEIMKMIIGTVLYLTTTCTLHYFGTRNKQKAPKL